MSRKASQPTSSLWNSYWRHTNTCAKTCYFCRAIFRLAISIEVLAFADLISRNAFPKCFPEMVFRNGFPKWFDFPLSRNGSILYGTTKVRERRNGKWRITATKLILHAVISDIFIVKILPLAWHRCLPSRFFRFYFHFDNTSFIFLDIVSLNLVIGLKSWCFIIFALIRFLLFLLTRFRTLHI